ncbi:MAG: hypothetical protein K2L59_02780 [Muribaculaceae bacterium]|nr:hypothetical protein [Muribaculaceae bacterium]
MKISVKFIEYSVLLFVPVLLAISCNTGIESTKAITMSRSERRETMPGAEERMSAQITSEPLGEWRAGKKFLISDNKASVLLERQPYAHNFSATDSIVGTVLSFERVSSRLTPGGDTVAIIEFRGDGCAYLYNTSRNLRDALHSFKGQDMPMMIDLDMVASADSLLRGRKVWTRSRLWYDSVGNIVDGRKFDPVTITRIRPGNMVFPLAVEFTDENRENATMFMNVSSSDGIGAESRTFQSLFILEDPRQLYSSVSPEIWENIKKGRVSAGMTKEECRLSLGNPAEVDAGHNWSSVIDIWRYRDGSYLQFQDGLLVNYRH